jgi:hypothetical protein
MREPGEGEEAGALTGAFAPEIPNPKFQIPKEVFAQRSFDCWDLKFPWDLGFGIWDLPLSWGA